MTTEEMVELWEIRYGTRWVHIDEVQNDPFLNRLTNHLITHNKLDRAVDPPNVRVKVRLGHGMKIHYLDTYNHKTKSFLSTD